MSTFHHLRLSFIGSLLLLAVNINAQGSMLAPIVSTSYDFRVLDDEDLSGRSLRGEYETGLINFGFGIDYIKYLRTSLAIKTGLRYSKVGYKTDEEDLRWPSEITAAGVYEPDPLLPFSGTREHIYKFIQIPFNLRYNISTSITSFYVDGGLNVNIALDKLWMEKYEMTRLNLGVNLGLGVQSILTRRVAIYGAPTFRYYLSDTLKNAISENLYSYGIEFGLMYNLYAE